MNDPDESRRWRELLDRDEIRELAIRYAAAVDGRDIDTLIALFVADADAGPWGRGRAALRRMFDDVLRSFTVSIHFVANHLIDFDENDPSRATGFQYARVEQERDGHWLVYALAYEDTYVQRNGRWLFAGRDAKSWYATEINDPPLGTNRVRLPDQPPRPAALPSERWPTWERFWGFGSTHDAASTRTVRLPAKGLDLTADIYGDERDPVVLLLHGGGQTRHSWGTTADTLARHGWCAIAVDARGHGDSDWSPDGQYRFDRFAADLLAIAARYDRPALVGASLGGLAALLAIHRNANDVGAPPVASGLVLVDVADRLNEEGTDRIGAFMRDNIDTGFADLEEVADAVAAYIPHRPRPRNLEGLRKNLRQRDDGRWVWHWDPRFLRLGGDATPMQMFPADELLAATQTINRSGLPTMLVRGKVSDVVSEEHARELKELIPDARWVDVAGAGHMVAGDSNDLFNEAVVEFLESVVKPTLRRVP